MGEGVEHKKKPLSEKLSPIGDHAFGTAALLIVTRLWVFPHCGDATKAANLEPRTSLRRFSLDIQASRNQTGRRARAKGA
ncbi:hypothetical protein [Methylocystis parvus]|uniref:Uncharacterized protein n=1 Tax=Methylocystis parvus TaxID=134 RepID=A0A6B8M354_9HYPH|nr:hypothetical protein [Methylocystis parvus]QGM96766.1 hypothetical protein F7D14_04280 [Methylocystis parvus]WBJ99359.1 hypothetical protein MMG94_15345 [Methylocystis parvus OBBP]